MTTRETFYSPLNQYIKIIWREATSEWALRSHIRPVQSHTGPLAGEFIVFTGALEIPRREAADLAASIDCTVVANVTKKATLLVVGDTDVDLLAGHSKSSKHRKAEEMASKGLLIRIIRETDFKELTEQV